jgi:hypothetical protein
MSEVFVETFRESLFKKTKTLNPVQVAGDGAAEREGQRADLRRGSRAARCRYYKSPGTDVIIFKIFSPKNSAKNWRF